MKFLLKAAPMVIGALKTAKAENFFKKTPKAGNIIKAIGGSAFVGGVAATQSLDLTEIEAIIASLTALIGAVSALIAQLQGEDEEK